MVRMLRLVIANLNYSSWSMRPWLALKHAGAEFRCHDVGLKTAPDWKERILQFSGAGNVPILVHGSLSVHESLAICEYAAELYPQAKLWPEARELRARGRAISCEMHAGFVSLRSQLTSNLRGRTVLRSLRPETRADIARVFDIWRASLESSGGPFLLGDFSIADCMFFPVAGRFRSYGVELDDTARRYSDALFGLDIVKQLEAESANTPSIAEYDAFLSH
jgi:glutathione S-transferase